MRTVILGIVGVMMCISLSAQNFRVHISTYNESVNLDYFKQAGIKEAVTQELDQNDLFKYYYTARYASYNEAAQVQQDAIRKGFVNARVIDIQKIMAVCAASSCGIPKTRTINLKQDWKYTTDGNLLAGIIFFDFDRDIITTESKQKLDKLYEIMVRNPQYHVDLSAYTDAKGTNDYNMRLAARRGGNAKKYLLRKGLDLARMEIKVGGENSPIAKNTTASGQDLPSGRKFNRRVEFHLKDPNGREMKDLIQEVNIPSDLKLEY